MKLHPPLIISSRLHPAIRVADCVISCQLINADSDGRQKYLIHFDFDTGNSHTETNLKSGVQGGSATSGISAILSFLAAAGESVNWEDRNNRCDTNDTNANLFPRWLSRWAAANSDEIFIAALELEESENCE